MAEITLATRLASAFGEACAAELANLAGTLPLLAPAPSKRGRSARGAGCRRAIATFGAALLAILASEVGFRLVEEAAVTAFALVAKGRSLSAGRDS